jgi:hypothetical protein
VLEAVEALPMPKTAADAERTLRTVTSADRMLVQMYKRITPLQQIDPATASHSACPPKATPTREQEAEALSPEALAQFDLEQRANEIFAQYLKAVASETATTEPP